MTLPPVYALTCSDGVHHSLWAASLFAASALLLARKEPKQLHCCWIEAGKSVKDQLEVALNFCADPTTRTQLCGVSWVKERHWAVRAKVRHLVDWLERTYVWHEPDATIVRSGDIEHAVENAHSAEERQMLLLRYAWHIGVRCPKPLRDVVELAGTEEHHAAILTRLMRADALRERVRCMDNYVRAAATNLRRSAGMFVPEGVSAVSAASRARSRSPDPHPVFHDWFR